MASGHDATRRLLPFLALLSLVGSSAALQMLFLPVPFGTSHEFIAWKLALEAAARGHEVDIVVRSSTLRLDAARFEHPFGSRLRVVPLQLTSYSDEEILTFTDKLMTMDPMQGMVEAVDLLRQTGLEQTRTAQAVLDKGVDVVAGDNVVIRGLQGLPRHANVTFVMWSAVGFCPPFLNSQLGLPDDLGSVPLQGSKLASIRSFGDRLKNVLLYIVHTLVVKPLVVRMMDEPIHTLDPTLPVGVDGMLRHAPTLILSSWALEVPRLTPPHVFVTGAVLPQPARPLTQAWIDWLESDVRPVVLVSLGTATGVVDAHRTLLRAMMAHTPHARFVYRIKGDAGVAELDNVKAVPWMPQNDLLAHPRVVAFVSHCGMNSLHEALYHGVPIIATPLLGDQFENAGVAVRVGAAVSLPLASVTTTQLVDGVHAFLANLSSYRASAARVSRVMRNENGARKAVSLIEELAATGSAHLVPVHALDSFNQRYCVDAIATLAVLAALAVYLVLWQCVRRVMRYALARINNKQKTN